ncbi:Pr6Pr family membrane protein [Nocardia sp. NPDC005998]|uniref:Pr6Pr family membrane protein n=1 Tax=Nocardia sp. NPDC005998 TaxID=3156894 RepID=UPI0033BE5F61
MLLAHIARWDEQRWVDEVAHRFMPIVMVVDRVLAPVVLGVSRRRIACWPVRPLGCGAYTLIRGPIVDWYPYPFTIRANGDRCRRRSARWSRSSGSRCSHSR